MALLFIRPLRHPSWSRTALAGPLPDYTLRECHVIFLLSTLPEGVRDALRDWLLAPTDLWRWAPPTSFSHRRFPFAEAEVRGKSRSDYGKLLHDELSAIRQTLDFPPQALSGLTRYGLLAAQGARLRQLAWAMWPKCAEREIKKMVA